MAEQELTFFLSVVLRAIISKIADMANAITFDPTLHVLNLPTYTTNLDGHELRVASPRCARSAN